MSHMGSLIGIAAGLVVLLALDMIRRRNRRRHWRWTVLANILSQFPHRQWSPDMLANYLKGPFGDRWNLKRTERFIRGLPSGKDAAWRHIADLQSGCPGLMYKPPGLSVSKALDQALRESDTTIAIRRGGARAVPQPSGTGQR